MFVVDNGDVCSLFVCEFSERNGTELNVKGGDVNPASGFGCVEVVAASAFVSPVCFHFSGQCFVGRKRATCH